MMPPEPAPSALNVPQRLLLGPGPSTVPPRVYQAMMAPVAGHLDPAFIEVMDGIQALLRFLFQTENELTLPISGTGSAAMEAAVANLVEPGDSVLVCINGYFGQRIAEMARRYGARVRTIHRPWGEVFTGDEVAAALGENPAAIVAVIHGETSTGAAQPIPPITAAARAHGALLLVDTVASLGGMPIYVDEWDIDVCYSGSQKCLSCPPGASPITFGPRAVAKLEQRRQPVTSWYLDLLLLRDYWGAPRKYHHTAPISTMYALYEGLRLVAEERLEARWARHQEATAMLYGGLEALGMAMHVAPEHRLASLTTPRLPAGIDEDAIRRSLLCDYNIEIAGGLGELAGQVWRIGLMGYSARRENVALLLAALRELL
jgi:alanine-glyoxylate transaminase / serine-glyoxylate transaminase / serine-pyruvate transaminase